MAELPPSLSGSVAQLAEGGVASIAGNVTLPPLAAETPTIPSAIPQNSATSLSADMMKKRKREDEGESTNTEEAVPSVAEDVKPQAPPVPKAAEPLAGDEIASFLEDISSVTPTIPAAAVNFYLMKNGVNTSDDRVVKMVALATQKFVADLATDSLQHCKQRMASAQGTKKPSGADKRFVLTKADLQAALKDHGVNMARPPYYV